LGVIDLCKSAIVFMDYDNVWITCEKNYNVDVFVKNFIDKIYDFMGEKGYKVNEFIAYGNYDNGKMSRDKHQTKLQTLGVQTRHCMNGKDSADIAIVCDALEKLFLTSTDNDTYIIVSCDKDITPLINKIKSQGKEVVLVTFAVNIDWDVMMNYGDFHFWFEEIIDIPFTEPNLKPLLDCEVFCSELGKEVIKRQTDINYSLFSNGIQKKYKTCESEIDEFRDKLIEEGKIEIYNYDFRGKTFHDGIRLITDGNTTNGSQITDEV